MRLLFLFLKLEHRDLNEMMWSVLNGAHRNMFAVLHAARENMGL